MPAFFKKFLPLLLSLAFIGTLALTVIFVKKAGYHVVYTATKSVPRGLYLIVPIKKIARFDLIEFVPPKAAYDFAKKNRWLPQNGTMIKYVFAVPGDHILIDNQEILVNHKKVGRIYKFYAPNKLLPQTKICGRLQVDQYLLLSTKSERSFDGRYFGLVTLPNILGKAYPIIVE